MTAAFKLIASAKDSHVVIVEAERIFAALADDGQERKICLEMSNDAMQTGMVLHLTSAQAIKFGMHLAELIQLAMPQGTLKRLVETSLAEDAKIH